MKKVAISQSNYIPWKGYFDLIASVDEFILFDDMQYTKRDWRNRNKIKTPNGLIWLSVPVKVKGRYHQKIKDTEIDGTGWQASHWNSLEINYKKAPHFSEIADWLKPLYLDQTYSNLSVMNRAFIEAVCRYLSIDTLITNSWDYQLIEGKTERLADICRQAHASEYVSGPSAKDYVDEELFNAVDIKLTWFDYSHYPTYDQLYGEFVHGVSIVDVLFNCGKNLSLVHPDKSLSHD